VYQRQIDTISNRADWPGPFVQLLNDDGTILNILNTDVAFDCVVTISGNGDYHGFGFGDYYGGFCGGARVVGSIANGKVIASLGDDGAGFQWMFVADDLRSLRAGSYRFGVKTTTNGQVVDLIDGTLAVIEGNPNG
jgi:hypothetical protein